MGTKKPKLKWVEYYWTSHWHYQDENGAIFGGVVKTGGALSFPYHPIRFMWYVGPNQYEPGELVGYCTKRSDAQRQLEALYVRYRELHAEDTIARFKEPAGV